MGITIIQKSDLDKPKTNPKIALVLAGGAVSGAAFKLGGLMALNHFMLNQRINDIDMFVGTSAGAIISVYLANGITVNEIMESINGEQSPMGLYQSNEINMGMRFYAPKLNPIRAAEFYHFNFKDFLLNPLKLSWDLMTLAPREIFELFKVNNIFDKRFRELIFRLAEERTYENLEALIKFCFRDNARVKRPSIPWSYIPTGIFTTSKLEEATRRNLEDNNFINDFKELYERRGKELFIVATNLDTAERAVFGHNHINNASISKAMQASIAIPLFYKPVTIDGVDYVDGAVSKTTSIDFAAAKGADLIICYNPFRSFNSEVYQQKCNGNSNRVRIAQDGIYAVLNQTMRTLLHTRLQNGLALRRKNPDCKTDIILVEPTEYDDKFFDMNPIAFWERHKAAQRGYESVKDSIRDNYDVLKKLLNSYGIDTSPSFSKSENEEPIPYLRDIYENILI